MRKAAEKLKAGEKGRRGGPLAIRDITRIYSTNYDAFHLQTDPWSHLLQLSPGHGMKSLPVILATVDSA